MSDWVVSCHAETNGVHFKSCATVIVHGFSFANLHDGLGASMFSKIRAAAHKCQSPYGDSAPIDIICSKMGVPQEAWLYEAGADIPDYNIWSLSQNWTDKKMNGIYEYPSMHEYLLSCNRYKPSTLSTFFDVVIKPKANESVYLYWLACTA